MGRLRGVKEGTALPTQAPRLLRVEVFCLPESQPVKPPLGFCFWPGSRVVSKERAKGNNARPSINCSLVRTQPGFSNFVFCTLFFSSYCTLHLPDLFAYVRRRV